MTRCEPKAIPMLEVMHAMFPTVSTTTKWLVAGSPRRINVAQSMYEVLVRPRNFSRVSCGLVLLAPISSAACSGEPLACGASLRDPLE
ncbi:MAG: hypothetical protein ACOC1F_07670 [Myxococcota bacterium]